MKLERQPEVQIINGRHKQPDMIVPASVSDSDMKAEVNRRTHKAGLTDRDGQRMKSTGAGKGDAWRPCDMKKYRENYDRIFNKK